MPYLFPILPSKILIFTTLEIKTGKDDKTQDSLTTKKNKCLT